MNGVYMLLVVENNTCVLHRNSVCMSVVFISGTSSVGTHSSVYRRRWSLVDAVAVGGIVGLTLFNLQVSFTQWVEWPGRSGHRSVRYLLSVRCLFEPLLHHEWRSTTGQILTDFAPKVNLKRCSWYRLVCIFRANKLRNL